MSGSASLSFLRLLCNLRWIAVVGQAAAVALVVDRLGIALSSGLLWAGIGTLALFNLYATWRVRRGGDASDLEVLGHMLIDIAVLTWLITLSGGIENPFASLFLIPIALSILTLPRRWMGVTAVASAAGYFASIYFGHELPPVPGVIGGSFGLHKLGMLVTFVLSGAVIVIFMTRTATAWRRSEREVALLREQFARNEGILALATHAASVAHELSTPLGTLTLMVEDLAEDCPPAQQVDFTTMKSLLEVCRNRVRQLSTPAGSDIARYEPVHLDDVIQHWQLVRPAIELHRSGSIDGYEKVDPAVGHLLQVLLNNAADAGKQNGIARVDLDLSSDEHGLRGQVRDYGVGFDRARPPLPPVLFNSSKSEGLGIGLALSHATVERLGGELSMQATEGRGVRVAFRLPAS